MKTPHLFAVLLCLSGSLSAQRRDATELFKIEIEHPRLPAISQGRTGTCWSFSTTSFLESELERLHGTPVDLSELHTVFYAYLEKARRYVRLHGKTQFDEGGLCHDVMHVIEKYGMVPQQAYSGLCEGDSGHDHGEMVDMLKVIVAKVATSERPGTKWEAAFRGVLEGYLGRVPDTVEIQGRTMTPKKYARDVLRIRPDDYRQLMSLADQPFWKRAELLVGCVRSSHQKY